MLDWPDHRARTPHDLPTLAGTANRRMTSSGRASLYQALMALDLRPGATVLVPTYHCPTMIAPVVRAGLVPEFFGLDEDALPRLAQIPDAVADRAAAIVVAHYFGWPRSLAGVRDWCDRRRIALIEDCAHCFFGQAGERPVGHWGDFAVASLTKFFPVPEGGLLVSAHRPLGRMALKPQGFVAQLKGVVDVLEQAERAGRLRGLRPALGGLFALKNRRPGLSRSHVKPGFDAASTDPLQGCDMSRAASAPLLVAAHIFGSTNRERIVMRRRENYERLRQALCNARGAHALFEGSAPGAPYAFALWVDDAHRVYQGLRAQGLPVLRWDHRWAGTPDLDGDHGLRWSDHVLQLLCHQDLRERDIDTVSAAVLQLLAS